VSKTSLFNFHRTIQDMNTITLNGAIQLDCAKIGIAVCPLAIVGMPAVITAGRKCSMMQRTRKTHGQTVAELLRMCGEELSAL
jgi:hypothetical protein